MLSVSFKSLEVPWECPIDVQTYRGFLFGIIAAVMPVVPALLVICNALGHLLTPNHHPQLHPLIAVRCIPMHSCMGSWVLAFRLEHQPVLSIMSKYYISISLCLEQPHLLRNRAFKAENKIGWKLLGGSMLLELYVPLFEKGVAFSEWRTVWLAGLWGVFFVRHACLKPFPHPLPRRKCGYPPNF